MKKYLAEAIGTMVLVLMGCGAAVSLGCNNGDPETVVGTAIAFGLAVVAMAYTIGGISGCHINPAITLGVFLSGRMSGKDAGMYIVFQVIGAIVGSAILYALTTSAGLEGTGANDLQANGAGTIPALGGLLAEIFFTCVFVLAILGVTSKVENGSVAGVVIGLTLTLVHVIGIHFTGTSVNPARSLGPALFAGGAALSSVWVFIVAPLFGGVLAALIWKIIAPEKR